MIYCVWYPSGGFGHFINAVLTLHGKNFARPKKSLEFSANGNSHQLDLVVPKYLHGEWPGYAKFIDSKNYCLLVDNGINNESDNFKSAIPDSNVIKICYSDYSWPVVAKTMITKAMNSSIEDQLPVDHWSSDAPWVRREKYFLFLRDHTLRNHWRPKDRNALYIDDLFEYSQFFYKINSLVEVSPFESLWQQWREANNEYIDPVEIAKDIVDMVVAKKVHQLTYIKDIWTQSVVYYYIWITFGIEVPHNDFDNFFTDTQQIIDLVS
jgi:hypothetical protein